MVSDSSGVVCGWWRSFGFVRVISRGSPGCGHVLLNSFHGVAA